MAKILFFDTECNSLDTTNGFIQELAWAIYDSNTKRLLQSSSSLLKWDEPYKVDPGALETTGLTFDYCQEFGRPSRLVFAEFLYDLEKCDAICGHNIHSYDIPMTLSNLTRGSLCNPKSINEKFKFDTMYDLPINNPKQIMSLKYLAYDHGFILSNAHQALADVFACAHVFFSYPYEEVCKIAGTELMKFHGYTAYGDEPAREAFYHQKFRWNREFRRWDRTARAYYLPTILQALGHDLFTDKGQRITFTPPVETTDGDPVELPEPDNNPPEIPF